MPRKKKKSSATTTASSTALSIRQPTTAAATTAFSNQQSRPPAVDFSNAQQTPPLTSLTTRFTTAVSLAEVTTANPPAQQRSPHSTQQPTITAATTSVSTQQLTSNAATIAQQSRHPIAQQTTASFIREKSSYALAVAPDLAQTRAPHPTQFLPQISKPMFLELRDKGSNEIVSFAVNRSDGHRPQTFKIAELGGNPRFDVSPIDNTGTAVLSCFKGTFNLTNWLNQRKSKWHIWSEKHAKWNMNDRKKKNDLRDHFVVEKVSVDREFVFNRLTDETGAIIRAIVRALLELHAKKISNDHLDNTDNYLFRIRPSGLAAKKFIEYDCHFIPAKMTSNAQSSGMSHDMDCVRKVIMKIISDAGLDFPPDLEHFLEMLNYYGSADWQESDASLLREHPALWPIQRRYYFWLLLSAQCGQPTMFTNLDLIMNSAFENPDCSWSLDWQQRIPPETAFKEIFRFRIYKTTPQHYFRYLRNIIEHIHEEGSTETGYKNIKSLRHEDYEDPDFVEVLISELFPLCLVIICEEIKKNDKSLSIWD